jgi:hypothetical protein
MAEKITYYQDLCVREGSMAQWGKYYKGPRRSGFKSF